MSVICEGRHDGIAAELKWRTYAGAGVAVHAPPGDSLSERAAQELREAEQVVMSLRKLLEPAEERAIRIDIYLSDTGVADGSAIPRGEIDMCGEDRLVFVVDPNAPREPLAHPLTRLLIARWFGDKAAATPVFAEGIAGFIAAETGTGPTIEEFDRWVQAELEAGRAVEVVGRNGRNAQARSGLELNKPDPAATSFVAFLVAHSGGPALSRYLESYDPDRQDVAATEAYQQPLAVLQEEWIARLRRKSAGGDALRSFLRRIVPLLRPYKWKQLEILGYLILAAAYNVVQPWSIKIVIDKLTHQLNGGVSAAATGQVFLTTLAPFLLFLLGINALNGAVSLRRAYAVAWLNQNILNTLQIRMYAHMQRLAHSFYVNNRIGDLMARLDSDLDTVQSALSQITNKALYQGFTVIGAVTALLILAGKSPALAIPILFIIPVFALNYYALRSRNKQASREQRKRVGQAMSAVQESLSAHALIKAFGMEERAISDYKSRIFALQRSKLRLAVLSSLTDLSAELTTNMAQLIVFGVGGYLVLQGNGSGLGVGSLAALLVLVKSIFSPIASLSGIGQTMQQATGAMERVDELFQEPITIADRPDAVEIQPLAREIRFENVEFSYGGNRPALRDVSFSIPAGSQVAIVGFSGSGKSTLVNLLLRFWDPERGRILFDGHDLRDVTLASLRGQIGLVFQETFIFNSTLRANIAIGRPGATDAEIVEAAKAARLHSFIETLPAGYDTVPGENGSRLSSGQKQRIAIARAFLRNPPILILDEATSALDAQTEAGILETLSELTKGRTTISVTHRISQAAGADRVFVIDSGRLVEDGSPSELVHAGGVYQKLYEEASGFVTNIQPSHADTAGAIV